MIRGTHGTTRSYQRPSGQEEHWGLAGACMTPRTGSHPPGTRGPYMQLHSSSSLASVPGAAVSHAGLGSGARGARAGTGRGGTAGAASGPGGRRWGTTRRCPAAAAGRSLASCPQVGAGAAAGLAPRSTGTTRRRATTTGGAPTAASTGGTAGAGAGAGGTSWGTMRRRTTAGTGGVTPAGATATIPCPPLAVVVGSERGTRPRPSVAPCMY